MNSGAPISRFWALAQTWPFFIGTLAAAQVQFAQVYARFPDRMPTPTRNLWDSVFVGLAAWAIHMLWLVVAADRYRGLKRGWRWGGSCVSGALVFAAMHLVALLPDTQPEGGMAFEIEVAVIVLGIALSSAFTYEAARRLQR